MKRSNPPTRRYQTRSGSRRRLAGSVSLLHSTSNTMTGTGAMREEAVTDMDFETERSVTSTSPSVPVKKPGKSPRNSWSENLDSSSLVIKPNHSKEFLKSLECPICLEVAIPPVHNCTAGHIICSMCRPKVKRCGICQGQYASSRNYAVESILSLVEIKCRHTECEKRIRVDKLWEHLTVCDYRPIICNETNGIPCRGRPIEFGDYENHISRDHKLGFKIIDKETEFKRINISNTLPVKWPVFMFKMSGTTFLLHREPSVSDLSLCVWISALAAEEEAERFWFRIRVNSTKEKSKSYCEWRIRANAAHKTVKDAMSTCNCVTVSPEMIIPYCERQVKVPVAQSYPNSDSTELYEYKWSMLISLDSST